ARYGPTIPAIKAFGLHGRFFSKASCGRWSPPGAVVPHAPAAPPRLRLHEALPPSALKWACLWREGGGTKSIREAATKWDVAIAHLAEGTSRSRRASRVFPPREALRLSGSPCARQARQRCRLRLEQACQVLPGSRWLPNSL